MIWSFNRWQRKIWEFFPKAVIDSGHNELGPLWGRAINDGVIVDSWSPDEDRGPEWYRGLDRLSSQPPEGEE